MTTQNDGFDKVYRHTDKRTHRFLKNTQPVKLPIESLGVCKRYTPKRKDKVQKCTNYKSVTLADGLCMSCWDRLVSNQSPENDEGKGRDSNFKKDSNGSKYLQEMIDKVQNN